MMASTSSYTNPPLINALSLVVIMCCATNLAHAAMAGGRHEASSPVVADGDDVAHDRAMRARYERWVAKHGRTYKDHAEKARRYEVFRSNAEFVDSYNAAAVAARGKSRRSRPRLATNKFSDLTGEEFEAMYLNDNVGKVGRLISKRFNGSIPGFMYGSLSESDVPASRNWTAMGAVTAVKDQTDQCASCWAFSAVTVVEGIHAIRTGNLVSLSEQQLLDCSTGRKNRGCNKGDMEEAFLYIAGQDHRRRRNHSRVVPSATSGVFWNGGLSEESAYPYLAVQSNCSALTKPAVATIRGFQYVPANNESALRLAVSRQPVSVALDARSRAFQHYSSGVYGAAGVVRCKNSSLNHALTAVGYGTDEHGTRYWLMKNSWGTGWGEGGYVKIARDVATDAAGVCGLAVQASYPVA
ncbi:senescence-specific cysteine protease SAG39-like [Miscanthus floridulus]|uniref:senescence-specific cysteine protease SAG39-like n=1 Tax=Miscanthus floridulus TaxID=154761 RepID=UPI00345A28EA